jgi:hypothetical protein
MADPDDRTVPLTLTLNYAHPLGALAPYFRGLEQGRAVAARCPACGRTWFPPRLACPDHGWATDWVELSGRGRVVSVTLADSTLPFGVVRERRAFALVALDGAVNLAFGRVAGNPTAARVGLKVRLERAPGPWPHPAQAAWFAADE